MIGFGLKKKKTKNIKITTKERGYKVRRNGPCLCLCLLRSTANIIINNKWTAPQFYSKGQPFLFGCIVRFPCLCHVHISPNYHKTLLFFIYFLLKCTSSLHASHYSQHNQLQNLFIHQFLVIISILITKKFNNKNTNTIVTCTELL